MCGSRSSGSPTTSTLGTVAATVRRISETSADWRTDYQAASAFTVLSVLDHGARGRHRQRFVAGRLDYAGVLDRGVAHHAPAAGAQHAGHGTADRVGAAGGEVQLVGADAEHPGGRLEGGIEQV